MELVGSFMICAHTKLHVPISCESLNITNKLKVKYRFHVAAILLFLNCRKQLP